MWCSRMVKKLIHPFQLFIREIIKDNAFRKTIRNRKMKATMIGAIGQSCIVLFGLLIMYCYMMYMIAAFIITLNLVVLIAIVIFPFIIWSWQAFARKVQFGSA